MYKTIIILCFIFCFRNGNSCDCAKTSLEKARIYNFSESELVFLGRVVSVKNSEYSIKILEVFKGNIIDTIIIGTSNSCSIIPNINEKWLIYTKYVHGRLITIDACSISRSFNNPFNFNIYTLPPPPKKEGWGKFDFEIKLLKIQATIDLNEEVDILRNNKQKSLNKKMSLNNIELITLRKKLSNQDIYNIILGTSVFFLIVIGVILFLKIAKLKK